MTILEQIKSPADLKGMSDAQLAVLSDEIREYIIKTVSKTGGHLASNLGAVELTVALHACFDCPHDKIVFDVGHQCYTHKILTGRMEAMRRLRMRGGPSGFPVITESEYDAFGAGHAGVSVSAALGLARARDLRGGDEHVVAVVGDGALGNGMIYEGINDAGNTGNDLIVVLNDNTMSISKNVGSFAKYLSSIRGKEKYVRAKQRVERKLNQTPVIGAPMIKMLKSSKDAVRDTIFRSTTIFEDLGFVYLGPVDGHNMEELEDVLCAAKTYHCPVFVHVLTVNVKGYLPSERNPGEYHGISKFNVETGNPEIAAKGSYSDVFGKELARLAQRDPSICAITAAMEHGTGLQHFARAYPSRFYDVGIAEQHAVTFAAALAASGQTPVFAVYSSFLQRAYDQLLHDVAIGGLHVVLGIDRAGVVGEDGETHHGLFDVSYLSTIPGTVLYAPSCYDELTMCLRRGIYEEKGLIGIRYPRGRDTSTFDQSVLNTEYTHVSGHKTDTLLISYGRIYDALYHAKQRADQMACPCDLLKLTRIFPIQEAIVEIAKSYRHILFFEEAYYYGGISQLLGDQLLEQGYTGTYVRIAPKDFIRQAPMQVQLEQMGLSEEAMLKRILQEWEKWNEHGTT